MDIKIDPLLLDLCEKKSKELRNMPSERFGLFLAEDAGRNATPELIILVQFECDTKNLEKAGLQIRGVSGDVATGTIAAGDVSKLAKVDGVVAIESSRSLSEELDLSIIETRADLVHSGPPGRRGAGTIVGIIDSGIDFTHPAFLKPDGTSRIIAIWDQSLSRQSGESAPSGFTYGVEYTKSDIDAALGTSNPFSSVRHKDSPGARFHGTHVAGIAAGDGSVAGSGQPAGSFIGVAPEAEIIVVRNVYRGEFSTSAETLDAANYIFTKAADLGKPCVINQSQGDNLGAHDGTSLLERGLDNLLGGAGRVYIKSAGNAANDQIHAEGTVAAGSNTNLRFSVPSTDDDPDVIDIWYAGSDAFSVRVIDSAGNATSSVTPGNLDTTNMPGGNRVRIDHRNNDPRNGDKRIFMVIEPGTAARVRSGNWTIELTGTTVVDGEFHAWIQRGRQGRVPRFLSPHENSRVTISTPGAAAEVISVGSYITSGAGVNSLSTFSSRGPTRDGRAAPTLSAPGQFINAPRGHYTDPSPDLDPYQRLAGTSMAAPHVAGTVALMFEKNNQLTAPQVRNCLTGTARSDANTGPTPNTAWGAGKLDTKAAVDCAPLILLPPITVTGPSCPPRTIIGPACPPRTFAAPCPPRTVAGPTCPPRTFGPPCPPRTIAGPTCPPRTFGPPCPPRTRPPVCPPRTLPTACPPLTRVGCPPPRTLPPGCPPLTRGGCPPPLTRVGCPPPRTRVGCPPLTIAGCPPPRTRVGCPPPRTTVGCPPLTRTGCPPLTRAGCPVPQTRVGCPPLTRAGCPPITRGACPPRTIGGCGPFPRPIFQAEDDWYDEAYYDEAYSDADGWYSEEDAWGYYDQADYADYEGDFDEAYGYDESWDDGSCSGAGNFSSEMTDEHGNMFAFEYDESWFEDPEG